MKRRLLLGVAAGTALFQAVCVAQTAKPRYKVSAAQLQEAVAQRFPLRYPVGGIVDLDVRTPRLRLLPERNRLASEVTVQASGPALSRAYAGAVDIEFALRYEPRDRSIRAHQLDVLALRLPGLPPSTIALFQAYLPGIARQALDDVVLHTLSAKDLALADAMGLQPDTLTVLADGLEIGFAPHPPPPRTSG